MKFWCVSTVLIDFKIVLRWLCVCVCMCNTTLLYNILNVRRHCFNSSELLYNLLSVEVAAIFQIIRYSLWPIFCLSYTLLVVLLSLILVSTTENLYKKRTKKLFILNAWEYIVCFHCQFSNLMIQCYKLPCHVDNLIQKKNIFVSLLEKKKPKDSFYYDSLTTSNFEK